MLMADAPAHQIYVLLAPVDETQNAMPEILCMVQVALEGAISKTIALQAVASGQLPQGDLIPWTIGNIDKSVKQRTDHKAVSCLL